MPARGRMILVGLALSLLAGLALLTWVALGGGGPRGNATARAADAVESVGAAPAGVRDLSAAQSERLLQEDDASVSERQELSAEALDDLQPWNGLVVDADGGAPIEGAEVELAAGERVQSTRTDGAGRYELGWPPDLPARLSIRHPRFVDATAARVDLAVEGRFALGRSAVLRGGVLPAGEQGTVTAWLQNAGSSRYWTQTDATIGSDGRFVFEDLTPGEYLVAASVPGRAVAPEAGLRLEPGQELELALVAREGARVAGRTITEPSGAPIPGLIVTAEPYSEGMPDRWIEEAVQRATSDASGRFEFAGLVPRTWRISASDARGWVSARDVDAAASGELIEVELAFPVAAALGGRVIDASGAGLAGREVAVFADGAEDFFEGTRAAHAVTDAQGWFRIDGVQTGADLDVAARDPIEGAPWTTRYGLTSVAGLEPGASQLGLVIELRACGSVSGRVLSVSGEPIAARVRAFTRLNARNRITIEAQSDAEGRFLIERIPAGNGRVDARAEGWRVAAVDCDFDGGEVELELEQAHALEGWAVDAQGLAVAGVQLTVQPVPVNGDERSARRARRSTATDDAGHFRFEDLRPGAWEVRGGSYAWRLAGTDVRKVEIPAAQAIELVFEPAERPASATIEGEVALPDGGAPTGIELEGLRGGVMAVEHGRFRVTGVAPATWKLILRADGHARTPLTPFELAPGGTYDIGRVLLQPSTHLTVRVQVQGGGDLDGARVSLIPLPLEEGGAGADRSPLRLDGTRRGRYETTDATRHAWQLVVDRSGFKRHVQRLEVVAEERQWVEVELERRN